LDTIATIALGLIAILIPCAILILAIAILLSAIAVLILPVAILLLCTITILLLCAVAILWLCAITILLLRAIAILTVPVLLWTVAVSIGLVLFPWFFFSWFFLPWFFLRGRVRLVLLILALYRECGGAEKQRQGRGGYQQLHEYSLQNLRFTQHPC
jgi:hypothetical protein